MSIDINSLRCVCVCGFYVRMLVERAGTYSSLKASWVRDRGRECHFKMINKSIPFRHYTPNHQHIFISIRLISDIHSWYISIKYYTCFIRTREHHSAVTHASLTTCTYTRHPHIIWTRPRTACAHFSKSFLIPPALWWAMPGHRNKYILFGGDERQVRIWACTIFSPVLLRPFTSRIRYRHTQLNPCQTK